ncbi:MAG: hypothetical protein L6Q97_19955 [Thermoanaerobaculia bacterium]|nr:hypothetical protein [Thermoanaerobaculia bacterium]
MLSFFPNRVSPVAFCSITGNTGAQKYGYSGCRQNRVCYRRGCAGVLYLPRDTRVEVSANKMEPLVQQFHAFLRGGLGK